MKSASPKRRGQNGEELSFFHNRTRHKAKVFKNPSLEQAVCPCIHQNIIELAHDAPICLHHAWDTWHSSAPANESIAEFSHDALNHPTVDVGVRSVQIAQRLL